MANTEWKSSGKSVDYVKVPTLVSAFECGFGTPFGDGYSYEEIPDDFVSGLKRPFVLIASGDSMLPNIMAGDRVIIEYAEKANHRDIVAVYLNGTFMIKVLFRNGFSLYLKSTNTRFSPIKIQEHDAFQILGRVTGVFREPGNFVISEYLHE